VLREKLANGPALNHVIIYKHININLIDKVY